MKKIKTKVLSLVLASMLIISSFSSVAAAAATKSMTGAINDTNRDEIYLVNGGTANTANLTDFLLNSGNDFLFETTGHKRVSDEKISAIAHVSGDNLVSLKVDNSTDTATLRLKSSTASGKEVISVLYEGSYTDDDGNDYTVKARNNLTVYVYDKDQIVFGEYDPHYATKDSGIGFDDFETFAQNANYKKTLGIYKAKPSADSALATFEAADLTAATSGITDKTAYSFSITGSDVHTSVADDASKFTRFPTATVGRAFSSETNLYTQDAGTMNVSITVKKLVADGSTYKASTSSGDSYTLKTKIEKKVDAATLLPDSKVFTIQKTDGKTMLSGDVNAKTSNVTDSEVVFPKGTTSVHVDEKTAVKKISGYVGDLQIGDARVGSIDVKSGTVEVTDGTVGDITMSGAPVTSGGDAVLISGGKVGNIDVTDVALDSDSNVTVNAGITGTICANGTVTIISNDSDTPIVTGKITAQDILMSSRESKITCAGVKSSADGSITLSGDDLNVNAIDLDSRETTVHVGDDSEEFIGKIPAPANAKNGTISSQYEDTSATVSGPVTVGTISLDSDTTLTFNGMVTADTINGDGTMKIAAGNLYVADSASGVTLMLTDKAFAAGTTVFKAASDAVDADDFNTCGFTLAKTAGTSIDTFKIASLSFAGLVMNKDSSNIAKGYSETFTATAYPAGTSIPAGASIAWELDGRSDIFELTSSGASATVKVNGFDPVFASENKTTLTATLYDADGYELDDYGTAKCAITAIATPDAVSDTNAALSVEAGSSYIMKVTASAVPSVVAGTSGVFKVELASKNGNEYFYRLSAVGPVDSGTGIYLNGNKIFVATVKGHSFTSDTTMDIAVDGSYMFKINSSAAPTVTVGSPCFRLSYVSKSGNDYFYKITSAGAAGSAAGIYVNGTRIFVATVKGTSFTSDTTVDLTVHGAYTFKITSATVPAVTVGSPNFKLAPVSKSGNDYFYKITSTGAAGSAAGIYVNGARIFVATVG
ncbi:hypothetical protein [Caproiciproducens galactitolivorans]|uniref:Uncharacterized protein n=1 Tax=Caproiciproducens galactitolivorans TaxID=642589 RepID=A0ABT4BTZ1_9FIRM|nr:hypothetical protein [Caproiciproducens galactitolivorans]MCY1714367.1 hypothetical protein [Caproiciproducens galactitolivorans]